MRNPMTSGRISRILQYKNLTKTYHPSSTTNNLFSTKIPNLQTPTSQKPCISNIFKTRNISTKPTSNFASFTPLHHLHTSPSIPEETHKDPPTDDFNAEVEPIDLWEEEDEADPEVGDGGDGGGVVLQSCTWGEKALSLAREVLLGFGEGWELYAFKASPRGYIYVRIDKLSNEYGCPSMEELESFNRQYKEKLDEIGAKGEIPDDLALEVSSPGADRLLRVPDDLERFREMPMLVSYVEDSDRRCPEKNAVYFLDSIETESRCCVWKLADVKENRDPAAKGRPMSRKQKDARLKLPYDVIKKVTLYISY